MSKSSATQYRPPIDPPNYRTGPGPLSPLWQVEPEPELPTDPLSVLERELEAFRAECVAAIRHVEDGVMPVGHNEIDWLNVRLSEVQRLNAGLTHNRRSSTIAAWPDPVLPRRVLCGPRELIPILGMAVTTLASVADQRRADHHA